MISSKALVAAIAVISIIVSNVSANADPATGHLRNYKPSAQWLSKNKVNHSSPGVQASECGMNTRLHFPNVQLFAWFQYNHSTDGYHGCPYGDCYAFTTFPQPEDMELAFLDAISFFWHQTGGIDGTGVKPISDPQTGEFGYEVSLSGEFLDGPTPPGTLQKLHDSNYPGLKEDELPRWPKGAADKFRWAPEPAHPKCGRICDINRDPGMEPGKYGSTFWSPASAESYPPPYGMHANCSAGSTTPVPEGCQSYCGCCKKDGNCENECTNQYNGKCKQEDCASFLPPPDPSLPGPQPGQDLDKCMNYCECSQTCPKGDDDGAKCRKKQCGHISTGCEDHTCPAPVSPPPVSEMPAPIGGGYTSQHKHKKKSSTHKESSRSSRKSRQKARKESKSCA